MAIKYCSWTTGSDTTGNGSASNPYKTITKASQSLTGGDEVRVAKSPAPVNLTPTFSFTNGSTTVTASSSVFVNAVSGGESDGSVRLGDFIKGGDGNWWEVSAYTSATQATLYQKYSGSTQSGVSSQKLLVTDTGAAANYGTQVQVVSSSGTSTSKLKISGGWNLSTETQDGETFFRQIHGTFDNRYGLGLYIDGKNYLQIEKLGFLRYSYGIVFINTSTSNTLSSITCNSNSSYGIYFGSTSTNNTLSSITCNSNSYGICFNSASTNNTLSSITCNSNSSYGIRFNSASTNNTLSSITCNNNTYGIYFNSSVADTDLGYITCNNNSQYGINLGSFTNAKINNYSGTGNTSGDFQFGTITYIGELPYLQIQHFKTLGDNRCYFQYGMTYRDTDNAKDEGGECLKFSPTSDTYYIRQGFYFAVKSGEEKTISAYIKKDSSFNGDVIGALYFMGKNITGWTDFTPSTSGTYQQKSLVASADEITEDGIVELRIKARGTAGSAYVDDLSIE